MMLKITGTWVLMDHTFKTATNVGYWDKRRRWKTLFNSVFLVMNEKKEVLSWTLTKSTGFIHVRQSLREVMDRLKEGGVKICGIVVDNCCQWKELLETIFGKDIPVKLDLFHAIKRVTETVSKKHRFFHVFKNEFSLVFRNHTDRQSIRTLPTPSSTTLAKNLDTFISQWEKIPESPLSNQKTVKSLENIRKHVNKGCLSDIPPGIGTNVNENIHKNLKRRISTDRKGILAAVASFGHFFYNWNQRRINPSRNVIPIELQPDEYDVDASYIFGTTLAQPPQSSSFGVNVEDIESAVHESQGAIQDTHEDELLTTAEIPSANECDFLGIDAEELSIMTCWAIHCTTIMTLFKGHKDLQLPNFVFWSNYLHLIFNEQESCSTNLDMLLDTHNLQMIESDDRKLVNAVLSSLHHDHKLSTSLEENGMDVRADSAAAAMTMKLKEEVITRQYEYYDFFKTLDVKLRNWLKNDYTNKSGYALPALANLLGVPIVMFTTASLYPLITIIPWGKTIISNDGVLVIAFDCDNHTFYGVRPKPQQFHLFPSPSKSNVSCKCGSSRKQTPGTKNCNKYICDCYKKLEPCSEKCTCLCCDNPRGKNETIVPTVISSPTCSRKRQKTSMQCTYREIKINKKVDHQTDLDKGTLAISIINYFIKNKLPDENYHMINTAHALFADTIKEREEIEKLMKYWRNQFYTHAVVLDSKY